MQKSLVDPRGSQTAEMVASFNAAHQNERMEIIKKAPRDLSRIIKTPQALIHIKHNISLLQYKYWLLLFSDMTEQMRMGGEPDESGFFYISMSELAERIGYTPKKSEIWNDMKTLKNQTLAFNFFAKDGLEIKYGAGFISEWGVSNSRLMYKFPSVLYSAARDMPEYKAIFNLLNWDIFNHFTGKYEAIIYKLCKDYVGVNNTPYMTIQQFRDYMGIKNTEYLDFKSLNRSCIKNPIDAINKSEVSDIIVTQEMRKEGRSVVGLYFKVEHKKQTSLFINLEEESVFRFAKVPITEKLQKEYLKIRPQQEHLELCLQRANEYGESLERAGKVAAYGAIYRKAITEGWHEQQAIKNAKTATRTAAKKAEAEQTDDQEEKNKHDHEEKAKAWAMFQGLTESEKKIIEEAFLKEANDFDTKLFQKRGREASPFKIFARSYVLK